MTDRDTILRLAREAGWSGLYITYNEPTGKADWKMVKEERLTVPVTMEQIERFATLVAAAERERCAKLVEPSPEHRRDASWGYIAGEEGVELLDSMAAAIRARGQPPAAQIEDRLARHGIPMPDDDNPSF